ncbi:MAG TPA: glycosyltransferase [Nitrococcus sp.]|nr:glycosyltransferase [Nitrococcus sp.]
MIHEALVGGSSGAGLVQSENQAPAARSQTDATAPSGRGIVLYDFLYCRGGAERLTLDLARGLAGAEVGIAFRRRGEFPDEALTGIACHEFTPWTPARGRGWKALGGLWAFRYRAQRIADYDWAVFSGSTTPAGARHRPRGRNLYYCHTIPRFAYDLYDWYLARIPGWQRPAFRALTSVVRSAYEQGMERMDVVLANSENVRARLRRYLGLESHVVWPPCDTDGYAWRGQGDYYLSTARLEPFKRVDVIVEAFRHLPAKRLIVASGGSDERRLRRLAAGAANIEFVGWQSDEALRSLVGKAIATVYMARDEDFGMSPVESMAAGKPVIAVDEGGLKETVVDGETGMLIDARPESIAEAVDFLSPQVAQSMRCACERRAQRFGRSRFLEAMRGWIDSTAGVRASGDGKG